MVKKLRCDGEAGKQGVLVLSAKAAVVELGCLVPAQNYASWRRRQAALQQPASLRFHGQRELFEDDQRLHPANA